MNVGKRQAPTGYTRLRALIGQAPEMPSSRGVSVLVTYSSLHAWLNMVAALVDEHLRNGETVTLITCRHHPSHILSYIENSNGAPDQDRLQRLAVVDAFTPSFGGNDEVFHKSLRQKQQEGYTIIPARSLAGIHSGAAKAFKHFKKTRRGQRQPATVIYDGLLIYQYCEPTDHLNRFLTHMVEAERTYAMITIIAEPKGARATPAYSAISAMVDHAVQLPHEAICDRTEEHQ